MTDRIPERPDKISEGEWLGHLADQALLALVAHACHLEAQLQRQEEALRRIMEELGVPGVGYPAPVANAFELARAALAEAEEPG